jgi:hypothetical protein
MTDINDYAILRDMISLLRVVDAASTDRVAEIRQLIRRITATMTDVLNGAIVLTPQIIDAYRSEVNDALENTDIDTNREVTTSATLEMFQLGAPTSNVVLDFDSTTVAPPERGYIIQKLWKVEFTNGSTGHAIISDTSDEELSALFNAQLSTALSTAPKGSIEDLEGIIVFDDLKQHVLTNGSQDLSSFFDRLELPGLVCRQLRDIDIDADPELQSLTTEQKTNLKNSVSTLNSATTEEETASGLADLQEKATEAGIFSISLGPTPSFEYSDLKRIRLQKDLNTIVDVTLSMPVVSWGNDVSGLPLRDVSGPKDRSNRKDDGTSYIVDFGGIDPVIRAGAPNPLPPTRYFNNGPNFATDDEGALERYMGGKAIGMNTTDEEVTIQTVLREKNGLIDLVIPPNSALWKIDKASFDLSNRHAYYTVFSASRAPPAGFMGVVLAPKQNRLGRGRGEIASGVTLANGISQTGKTFNLQDANGAVLSDGQEVPSGLKGLTSHYDGHAIAPADLLEFLETNDFEKGVQYLTIPANATLETVEDVLIPAGQFVPQVTQALATLMQFVNGKYIQDGGPARFQAGLIPFMPGTPAYTPEWHINWIAYNCGDIICDGALYSIMDIAPDQSAASWARANRNVSFGPPGPNPSNATETRYSPAFPDTFDPVQLRCDAKWARCFDYVSKIKGAKDGEISLSMLPQLEEDNKIFFTDSPPGAARGWVKFLVVNCPLPVIATINIVSEQQSEPPSEPEFDESKCVTCSCSRESTFVSINGDLNPIWLEEDTDQNDKAIDGRILKFKVGDNIAIRSTTGTMHGVSLRFDDTEVHKIFDNSLTLETIQADVLNELKDKVVINNEDQLENNFAALSADIITFHGGIPITFTQKATTNPLSSPDGVVIADFTIKEEAANSSGSVACTVHGVSMSFRFTICPLE